MTEFYEVQRLVYVQVLRAAILAALLHDMLQQRASAKLCGVVQGMELRNFRRGRHLYWAGRPSRWASAHVVVISISIDQVATWYGGRPLLRPYCVRRGLSSLSQKGTALPNFRLVSIVAKRLDGSKRHFVGR